MNENTPWGWSDRVKEIAPGIVRFDTPRHGGYKLDSDRVEKLLGIFRNFKPFAGLPWFEEDCDWALVALAFPEAFSCHEISCAAAMVEMGAVNGVAPAVLLHPSTDHLANVRRRVDLFRRSVAHLWEHGSKSCGSGIKGWRVHFSRGGESRVVEMPYLEKAFYSSAELDAFASGNVSPTWELVLVGGSMRKT